MTGPPGHGCWRGGAIWGVHGIDVGGAGIRWASPPGWGIPMILFTVPLKLTDLLTPGRFGGAGGPLDAGASGGSSLHLEKSMGGRPGGGGRYPDIPAADIPGVVMPPEEAVAPHPGDSPTTWLHDGGKAPIQAHLEPKW